MIFVELYQLVHILTAFLIAGFAIFFRATFIAGSSLFTVPQAHVNQLAHAIMHVNSSPG
jgi:hypothetical protein